MVRRLNLQEELEQVLGNRNVYFQPPENVKLNYPCIIYHLSNESIRHADNKIYKEMKQYTVMIIDKDPDSELPTKVRDNFEYCSFDRFYTVNNLNHFVYRLFY